MWTNSREVIKVSGYFRTVVDLGKGIFKTTKFSMKTLVGKLQCHNQKQILSIGLNLLVGNLGDNLLFCSGNEFSRQVEWTIGLRDGQIGGFPRS